MGGGTILIIILTNFMKVSQHVAQATNILFFIPTSISAIFIYAKSKNVNKKLIFKMIPTGILGGIVGAYISGIINPENLRKYFGIFLLLLGVYEIIITVKNKVKGTQNLKINLKKKRKLKGE